MNDKEFNALKKRLEKYCRKWRSMLGLKWWKITYVWSRESIGRDTGTTQYNECATTSVQWPYRDAKITFNMPCLLGLSDGTLENDVIHEHVHILVNEMRFFDEGVCHEERVVTDLTSAFQWTYDHLEE